MIFKRKKQVKKIPDWLKKPEAKPGAYKSPNIKPTGKINSKENKEKDRALEIQNRNTANPITKSELYRMKAKGGK